MKCICKLLITAVVHLALTGGSVFAAEEDVLNLKGMSVIGNQELPKSLMVIPWKHSELGELMGHSMDSLLDSGIKPVDHDVFKRKLEFYRLQSDEPLQAQ